MKQKQNIFLLIITLLFVFTFIYGINRYKGEDFGLYEKSTYSFNAGWFLEEADGSQTPIYLPADLNLPANTEYSISTYIPEEFPEGMTILFRSSQQSVRVQIDGETIYERGQNPELYPGDFRGSSWNTVRMPREYAGKKLTISFLSPYESFSGVVGEIQYGYKTALLKYIIDNQLICLIAATIMVLIGLMLFIFHGVKASSGTSSVHITYLALFAIFSALYLFGESKMLQFYTSNEFFITTLPFLSQIILPIPLFMYLKTRWMPEHRWIAEVFQWVFAFEYVLIVMLQILNIADLYETKFIFHIALIPAMISILVISCLEVFKYKNQNAYLLAGALAVLILGSAAGVWELYMGSYNRVSFCAQVGVLGFELVMAIDSIQVFYQYEAQLREKKYYEKLAYIDALTDGKNRNAYMERAFELSRMEKRESKLCYALFDMNNLKNINDKFGHVAGDDAIQRIYKCLVKAFGKLGDCYRIGGDEFAVIMSDCTEAQYQNAREILNQEIERNNTEVEYILSLAGGYAVCGTDEDLNFEALMHKADKMLYENKREIKAGK